MTQIARKASPLGDAPGYGNRQDPGTRAADTDPSLRRLATAGARTARERGLPSTLGLGGRAALTAPRQANPASRQKSDLTAARARQEG